MAQSLEDGVGDRLRKQEAFIGVNLGLTSAGFLCDATVRNIPFTLSNSWNFNEGMTISGGYVTVPVDGIYNIQLNANFQSTTTTAPRVNTYIYVNGLSLAYTSTYGPAATVGYTNANIANSYKLTAGDMINVTVSSLTAGSRLQGATGSGFSVVLSKPL